MVMHQIKTQAGSMLLPRLSAESHRIWQKLELLHPQYRQEPKCPGLFRACFCGHIPAMHIWQDVGGAHVLTGAAGFVLGSNDL